MLLRDMVQRIAATMCTSDRAARPEILASAIWHWIVAEDLIRFEVLVSIAPRHQARRHPPRSVVGRRGLRGRWAWLSGDEVRLGIAGLGERQLTLTPQE
jgi:hypothetical protein